MKYIGKYSKKKYSLNRRAIKVLLELCQEKRYIKGLIELDITDLRKSIKEFRKRRRRGLSLTACIIRCIVLTLNEFKDFNAYRKGGKSIIVFDDVDVTISIERVIGGEKVPLIYVIRKANEKSAEVIHDEIREAQRQKIKDNDYVLGQHKGKWILWLMLHVPYALRKILLKNPFIIKQLGGTVGFTSLSAYTKSNAWALNMGFHTLSIAIGGISKRPKIIGGKCEIRECMNLTIMFDHELIDGAPAARFITRLKGLVEGSYAIM